MERYIKNKYICAVCAIICTMLWGTAYPVIKSSYSDMGIVTVGDKLMFAGLRFFVAGIMVMIVCGFLRKNILSVQKSKAPYVLLYSLLLTVLQYFFNYIGVGNTTATKTSVLTSLSAFLGVIIAPIIFKSERLTVQKIIGCIVGAAGVIIVNLSFFSGGFCLEGEGMVLAATVCNTLGSFVGKKITHGKVFEITAWQLTVGGAILILISLVMSGSMVITVSSALRLLHLAFVSAAAFCIWTMLLVYNEAGKIMIYNLLIPVFGSLWSYVILGEKDMFEPYNIVSIILICIGIVMVNTKSITHMTEQK